MLLYCNIWKFVRLPSNRYQYKKVIDTIGIHLNLGEEEEEGSSSKHFRNNYEWKEKRRRPNRSQSTKKVIDPIIIVTTKEMKQRWKKRQKRVSPPSKVSSNPRNFQAYSFQGLFHSPTKNDNDHHHSNKESKMPLWMTELCQKEKTKKTKKDFFFFSRQNKKQNETPRILIMGILNSVGYSLALTLKHRCNIDVIMGMDMMIPNTFQQRDEYLRRANSLRNQIPSLQYYLSINVPTTLQYHPMFTKADTNRLQKFHENYLDIMDSTQEINLVHAFAPTHIVHVASYQPIYYHHGTNHFQESSTQQKHKHHQYDTLPYFTIQHNLATLEYILSSMAYTIKKHPIHDKNESSENPKLTHRPHFTYITSIESTKNKEEINFWKVSKKMEQVLVSTYANLFNVSSIGLQLDSIFGPMTSSVSSQSNSIMDQYVSILVSPFCWERDPPILSDHCHEQKFINHYQKNYPYWNKEINNYVYVDGRYHKYIL